MMFKSKQNFVNIRCKKRGKKNVLPLTEKILTDVYLRFLNSSAEISPL